MSETLRSIVEAAKTGDRQALNTLAGCVDRFARIFHGKLSRAVRQGYGSTIDFVLEGMAEALANLKGFEYRSDEELYAWAAGYIRNRIVSTGRDASRQKRSGNLFPIDEEVDDLTAQDPTASQIIANQEVRDRTGNALLALQLKHPAEMDAVLLRVFESQSWADMREAMGLTSDKRARTLFAKGIDLLRPEVEKALGRPALSDLLGQ